MADAPAIIVCDDEPDLRDAVAEYLGQRGFDVRCAGGGAELRILLAERAADLVLLDIAMPGESGLSVARSLRAQSDIGIVILSAAADVLDRVVGLEVGADDYIAKPVDLRELVARLRAVLRRRQATTPAPPAHQSTPAPTPSPMQAGHRIRMGRTWLELEARRLIGPAGQEIPLGPSEFALLRAFAERPGRVLTREALLELAHPRGEEHFDRSIDVRIARIRRKVEATPDRPAVIRTIRGAGYVFDPTAEA
ncbi:response regulator transcription factor [Roseomonas frigidaquae]|uniref:Response regulator transcription factor n=1 Tax=Falsiroseomonas frigidaquae TaxID=487318 RepID=A0ABX1F3K3_9PROT|nr:response regulator transcription factor [Falsiroseomonas frigidaquae]NKE46859.1 response regulator transcription factor [Falsiroseomonas frigidaquae]